MRFINSSDEKWVTLDPLDNENNDLIVLEGHDDFIVFFTDVNPGQKILKFFKFNFENQKW